jgi:hypothetical protein
MKNIRQSAALFWFGLWYVGQYSKRKFKNQKPIAVDDLLRPIQWYHCHADPIWPDGTFKCIKYSFSMNTVESMMER